MFLGWRKYYKKHNFVSFPLTPCLTGSTAKRKKMVQNLSHIQAYLGDIVGSVPDHLNKVNIAIKQIIRNIWFPSAYKSYVYTIL